MAIPAQVPILAQSLVAGQVKTAVGTMFRMMQTVQARLKPVAGGSRVALKATQKQQKEPHWRRRYDFV